MWIYEGKRKYDWEHTSSLICIQAEINRDHKKRPTPFSASDFNPYIAGAASEKMREIKEAIKAKRLKRK